MSSIVEDFRFNADLVIGQYQETCDVEAEKHEIRHIDAPAGDGGNAN